MHTMILEQTVVQDKVVALVVRQSKRVVYTRADGTQYVLVRGRRCELIKGVALATR